MAELHDILVTRSVCIRQPAGSAQAVLGAGRHRRERPGPAGSRLLPEARAAIQGGAREVCRARDGDVQAGGMGREIRGGWQRRRSWGWKRSWPRLRSTTLPCAIPRPPITTRPSPSCRPWLRTSIGRHTSSTSRLPTDVDMNVDQPKFMQEVDRQMQQTSLADWKVYLKWQLLNSMANSLSAPFVEENFAFNGKYLSGATEMKPRWKRCAESTDRAAGRGARQEICRKIFPARGQGAHAGDGAQSAGGHARRHPERPWMSDDTKEKAMAKIATFNPKIGYPDKWKDYSHVEIRRDALLRRHDRGKKFRGAKTIATRSASRWIADDGA